jgi:predicted DsbA family dithiol-disulfide isomerase
MTTIYFDYLCPYAWRGLELLNVLQQELHLDYELRHFSLEQGNHPQNTGRPRNDPMWKLNLQPIQEVKGLTAFLASGAAKQQGPEAHMCFALEVFRLRHQDKADLNEDKTYTQAVERSGLSLEQFHADLANQELRRAELARDLEAAGNLAVFGTPTFVLPSGEAAYFRFANLVTDPTAAVALWNMYVTTLESNAHIETIKRPRK